MFTRRIAALLAAGALVTGAGAAVALADDSPTANPSNVPSVTCPTTTAVPAVQEPIDQLAVDDEQAATNDVAAAANDVQVEADNESADDESGDQQGSDDQSEEPDDACQSGD